MSCAPSATTSSTSPCTLQSPSCSPSLLVACCAALPQQYLPAYCLQYTLCTWKSLPISSAVPKVWLVLKPPFPFPLHTPCSAPRPPLCPLPYAVPHPATAIFFLVALLLFLPLAATPHPGWLRVFAAWACISIGVFCKEQCVTVVGVCAVWEVVRLLQEWHRDEEAAAAQDNLSEAAAAVSSAPPPSPRMRRLVTCALLRWSCFTLLTLSLLFFRLRFNDHKPARCCNVDNLSSCYMRWNSSDLIAVHRFSHATLQLCPRGKSCSSGR